MLDQNSDKALHRAEDRPVQHDRGMARAILADIDGAEPPRHVEIELDRAALPLPAERIAEVEFELRPVERALARVESIGEPGRPRPPLSGRARRGPRPRRCRPASGGRSANLIVDILKAEIAVDRQQQLAEGDRFAGDLVFGAEDMRVILGEAAHPHDPVQRARRLVAVAAAEFGQPQRQFAVALSRLRKISTWPGQFIGLTASTRSSRLSAMNMFSRKFSQWPEASHRLRSSSSGPRTS